MLAAIDLETTGRLAGFHEIVEIAVVPFDGSPPFHRFVKPEFPERLELGALHTNRIDIRTLDVPADDVADWLHEWIERHGRLTMVAHNLPFEVGFLQSFLGCDRYSELFSHRSRCTVQMAIERGFEWLDMNSLCDHYGIKRLKAHSALYDAYAGAELFKKLNSQRC